MILHKSKKRLLNLLILLVCGIIIFILDLGGTGLVDETPPLFAAAGRAMSESGDWLTPKVNGMFRFDKPPLLYWLMGFFYSLPNNEIWDSLGTLSARLPSAMGSLLLMLMIGDTLFCWPQEGEDRQFLIPIVASLGFALSPFIIIWSRTAVSDALLTGTLGISLLLFWRRMASENNEQCISAWVFLGFAILTKGPVAIVLATLTITFFLIIQKDWRTLLYKIHPKKGFLITMLLSIPWYILELIKEGKPFWDNFFGYHNFQRYTSVVNNHAEPFWFYLYIMIFASLPFTPFLFHGVFKAIKDLKSSKDMCNISETLHTYSLCWLASVLIFFSISATKLPSYWLPAIPAASILISNSVISLKNSKKSYLYLWIFNILILFGISIAFFFSNIWLRTINDPEMPNLGSDLVSYGIIFNAKLFFSSFTILAIILFSLRSKKIFLYLQIFLLIGQSFLMSPIRKLADTSRQLPLRNISKLILNIRDSNETLAMIGIRKPSLHYYSRQIVFYEPNTKEGLINLSDRLINDRRENYEDQPDYEYKSLLLVIDEYSSRKQHWSNINHQKLGEYGIYNLWRIQKSDLNNYSEFLINNGYKSNWKNRKVEKF